MDTYTKQVDCPEIQGLWEPKIWDRYYIAESELLDTHKHLTGKYLYDEAAKKKYRGVHSTYEIGWWLPRQEDWQNILFKHYAPAVPTPAKIRAATIIMHREFVDFMEAWKIDQPCEAWARLFMNFHNKRWTNEGWV
ncbi:hypothetical protein LCGC14_3124880 [marine sediment metagenome]|uniref:Uncharacterized protein n=1 Tax=marine sediment metagenome TaxID=412755 RepID=A0A0F8W1G4_9ZZZZ